MNDTEMQKIKEQLMKVAKKELRASYRKPDGLLDICASKVGGNPAVPSDFIWPEYTGKSYDGKIMCRPLSFMAQINLKDIAKYDTEGLLPKSGILSFFYELMSMKWGFETEDRGCSRVYYFSDETQLVSKELPNTIDEEAIVPEFALDFTEQISLPDIGSIIDFDTEIDWDDYIEVCAALGYKYDEWGDVIKLLGYPDVIQNPMEEECERVTRGYRCGCPEDYAVISEEEKADIKEKAKDWMLLFQMGTIEENNTYELMFGDCGHIYFWIKKEEIEKRNFDSVWLILQCS